MTRVDHIPPSAARRHILRVASLLKRAETHLSAASSLASDRYQRDQLNSLTHDLRSLGAPLIRFAQALPRDGEL